MAQEVDQNVLRILLAQKVPQREMARRLNIPRSSLQRIIKDLNAPPLPEPPTADALDGVPVVDMGKLTAAEAEVVRSDFWELIEWWRERKMQRVYQSTPRETLRQTYHVEKRYIRLIHQEAEGEGVNITEVVNRALKEYFDKK